MHHDIAVIHYHPAFAGFALLTAFLAVFSADRVQCAIGQRIQHAVAGAGADHKVVGEGSDLFDVQQEDVFPFLVLQQVDNGVCEFKWFQESPQ